MSLKVLKTHLKRRGYKILDFDDQEINFKRLDGVLGKAVFLEKEKINIEDLTPYLAEAIKNNIHMIFVYDQITNPALKEYNDTIVNYFDNGKNIELIQKNLLAKDILTHKYNLPFDFRKLTKQESKLVLKNYGNIDPRKFPAITPSDPISIVLAFKENDIVEKKNYYDFVNKKVDRNREPQISYQHVRAES